MYDANSACTHNCQRWQCPKYLAWLQCFVSKSTKGTKIPIIYIPFRPRILSTVCKFQIPNDLPMPYEITEPEEDDGYNLLDNRAEFLVIESPFINDPCEACLEMEVIGILPVVMIPNYCSVDKGLAHCLASSSSAECPM